MHLVAQGSPEHCVGRVDVVGVYVGGGVPVRIPFQVEPGQEVDVAHMLHQRTSSLNLQDLRERIWELKSEFCLKSVQVHFWWNSDELLIILN